MTKAHLNKLIDSRRRKLADLSDSIWEFAETRFEEVKSSEVLSKVLEDEGFSVQRDLGIPNAFVADYGQGKPVIGFLGEYDALSGLSQKAGVCRREPVIPGHNGHGCGHNMLGVASLGAAIALKQYLQEKRLDGTVVYYGCPGEEGGSGKAFMARAGVFDRLDAAVTWHPGTLTCVSSGSSLANIQVYFKYTGKAAHAAACPYLGRSALDAVELFNVGVNYLREHIIPEARVHYAVVNTGGKSPNVVQPEAEVLYLIRAPKNDQVRAIYQRVLKIAQGAALMTETDVEVQVDKACSNVLPNEVLEKIMQSNLDILTLPAPSQEELAFAAAIRETLDEEEKQSEIRTLAGRYGQSQGRAIGERLQNGLCTFVLPHRTSEIAMSGSTDVGDVSWIVPTVQCNVSCYALGTPGHSWQLVSQGKSSWAHKGLLAAAKAMAGTALDLYHNPGVIQNAKIELDERRGGEPYRCPIPDDVNPSPVKKG